MEEKKNLPQQYINTPFAYTKFSKNLTLLQQSVLNKVSEHLQSYIQQYFGSELRKSRDVPRPLFSEADKNNGMPEFVVPYAELGVSINNYSVAHEAVKEVLALTVDAPGRDKDGNPAIIKYNIFTKANISSEESNGVTFGLNPEVVDYVFDMSQGYVRHPADIARIGQVERMPMMYYYLFKKSEKWRDRVVHLTVTEIKEYLGMRSKVTAGTDDRRGRPVKDGEIKEAYPKFSKFNQHVLAKSIDDINRLRQEGLLDVCVSYEPVYNGKRKVGNPAFIRFSIFDTIDEMQKANGGVGEQSLLFVDSTPGAAEWNAFVTTYKGPLSDYLPPLSVHSFKNTKLTLSASREDVDAFNNTASSLSESEKASFIKALHKAFGAVVYFNFFIPKK